MPNQALPALSRCGVAFALLLSVSCGKEREPWYGFELFPAAETPADGSAGATSTSPTDTSDIGDQTSVSVPDTSVGTGTPATSAAAGSGGSDRATPAQTGVQTGAPDSAMPERPTQSTAPKSFRITELQLRDPHVFAGTQDLTEEEVLGQSVNRTLIPAKLTKDGDGDGSIDVSVVAILSPFDPSASPDVMPTLTFVNADCPVNSGANPACSPLKGNKGIETTWTLEQRQSGNCMEPMMGTTSNYQPAITVPNGPCFQSTGGNDFMMDLGGIKVQVIAGRVSATYQQAGLVRGLLAGFVTRTAAMQATLPSALGPMVAGDSLATYIRMRDYDQAASPNGQDGFWMYLNFVAKPVEYTP